MFRALSRKLAVLGVAWAALFWLGNAPAQAQLDCPDTLRVEANQTTATCSLGLDMSKIIDLPEPARDVLVSNPGIASAVMRTSQRIYITGAAIGQTNIFIFGRDNEIMVNLALKVERDFSQLEGTLNRLIPGARIDVELINDNIVLSGTVRNAADASRASDLADIFANGGANSNTQPNRDNSQSASGNGITFVIEDEEDQPQSRVVNLLVIEGQDQVQLRVTVAEINRNIVKQLGIDIESSIGGGNFLAGMIPDNVFPVNTKMGTGSAMGIGFNDGVSSISSTLRALEVEGVIRTLAEPTLTAISGEAASFLVGGEFPIPTGRDEDGIRIEFKPYGVGLAFTPVVLSDGRISMRIKTEVSEMSSNGAIFAGGGGDSSQTLSVPSLRVRRAETTLELPSGGSMILGGLLQDNVRQAVSGFPGLMDLPILGTLFRSRDFQREETELVIIVTPYLVRPVPRSALAQPDAGFAPPSDAATIFLGRLNRMYGVTNQPLPQGSYHGQPGFIIE
ncbi:MAG: type II and III secretion system protein family protein [Bauldia sp.]|nr:type II and III secretion system protein family protein [Bauldia sp.]